jgi:hypothetical protein
LTMREEKPKTGLRRFPRRASVRAVSRFIPEPIDNLQRL